MYVASPLTWAVGVPDTGLGSKIRLCWEDFHLFLQVQLRPGNGASPFLSVKGVARDPEAKSLCLLPFLFFASFGWGPLLHRPLQPGGIVFRRRGRGHRRQQTCCTKMSDI